MKKLWQKEKSNLNPIIEDYTIDNDFQLDNDWFFKYDIEASLVHVEALKLGGILDELECKLLKGGLTYINKRHEDGLLNVEDYDEDCHTTIENELVDMLDAVGKKVHTGRSRNDQSLVAIRLFMQDTLSTIDKELNSVKLKFSRLSRTHAKDYFIGYSHTQQAMLTTLGHYYDAFYYQLEDDMDFLRYVKKHINQNPLGSGAGFGSAVDLSRSFTTKELGFRNTQMNSLYCQNSRGKFELLYVHVLSQVMLTLQRFDTDMLMYTSREFAFFKVDDSITTGSSMMPQKKNLDVFEIMRGKHAEVASLETRLQLLLRV